MKRKQRRPGMAKNFGTDSPNPQLLGLLRSVEWDEGLTDAIFEEIQNFRHPQPALGWSWRLDVRQRLPRFAHHMHQMQIERAIEFSVQEASLWVLRNLANEH